MLVTPGAAVWPMSSPPMEGGVLAGTSLPQAQLDSCGEGVAWGRTAFGRVLDRGVSSMVPSSLFCPLHVILYGACFKRQHSWPVSSYIKSIQVVFLRCHVCASLWVRIHKN